MLFTFPSRYWFTIGRQLVLSLGRWSSRIPTGFHVSRGTWVRIRRSPRSVRYGPLTLCGAPFQKLPLDLGFLTPRQGGVPVRIRPATPTAQCTPAWHAIGLGSFRFARRYYGSRCYFLFLRVLRCFSSPRSLLPAYVFSRRYYRFACSGFPHSEIPGSQLVCSSPRLIAACHVLHRRLTPRHPPSALSSLIHTLR